MLLRYLPILPQAKTSLGSAAASSAPYRSIAARMDRVMDQIEAKRIGK